MGYHIIGYAFFFGATDMVHRSVMENLLNQSELSLLKIPNTIIKHHPEIFMRLNDDEIFYDGDYYDVKNESADAQFSYFETCKDAGEKNWHHQLCKAQTNSHHSDSKNLKPGTKLFFADWFNNFLFLFLQLHLSPCLSVYLETYFFSDCEDIPGPPPKFV